MDDLVLAQRLRAVAQPLPGGERDYDGLLDIIGDAQFVLLGEASHGTAEFYHVRAALTRRLIAERGFTAVAVEADWPDAYRVNRFVRGDDGASGVAALGGFRRFPAWMWRNTVVVEFIEWLRAHNAGRPADAQAGFYGLDLYSLHASMAAVVRYLEQVDPAAAARARDRYSCFDHFGHDPQVYGYFTSGGGEACEDDVVAQLVELQRAAAQYSGAGPASADEFFFAEQNARLAKNAEEYYRAMYRGRDVSWNIRDSHMAETLDALVAHLAQPGGAPKVVVWAHNSHLGDARATEMGARGEHNVGQLVRERYGTRARLIGFSTHTGTVTAANDWGDPADRKRVRPSITGSYEELLHSVGLPRFALDLRRADVAAALRPRRLERAIGVIYRPQTERWSHYFEAELPAQFDAIIHIDETTALQPLDRTAGWDGDEPPETFPSAL